MKPFILIALMCCAVLHAASQQTCPLNIDFEEGNFTNWQCSLGSTSVVNYENVIDLTPSVPTPGRHQLITADADGTIPLDPYGKFPALCPYGGKYSVKLGNDNSGGEAEGMSFTFTVPATEDTFSFTYFYAVVFQNPGHNIYEQPRFFVTAYEVSTGNVINCASYNYVSTGALPGFTGTTNDTSILYKNWSPSSIQFVNLANKQVRLEFKTADCTLGGHFGYAYFDVGSGCSNILATAPYCIQTNSLLLNAPYGFQYYTWYNETFTEIIGHEQNLKLSPPPVTSGKFYVDLNPYPGYGCRDTVYADVHPLPIPDTPQVNKNVFYCQYDAASELTAKPAPNSELFWYTDTTDQPFATAPVPATLQPGNTTYYVSQKILFGCESFHKEVVVRIDPVPDVSFTINQHNQCLNGNNFTFISTSSNLEDSAFIWTYGDGHIDSGFAFTSHKYDTYGNFSPSLKIRNGPVCYREINDNLLVIPKPVAAFSFPPVLCQQETSVVLNNLSSVPQGLSAIAGWYWQINNTESTDKYPSAFIAGTPGDLPVSLAVITQEGCRSDTTQQILKVHYRPQALFSYDAPLCSNKLIHFKDASALPPAAAGESVTAWHWQLDNTATDAQNPLYQFAAGARHATLTSQSNFGCNSVAADSLLTIYPEPVIAISINDSCVYRAIRYTAQDLADNVTTWLWDWGKGVKGGNAAEMKSFSVPGDNSFTLYGQTAQGCTDTLPRPFAIYNNTAFAGRDTLVAYDQPVQLNAHGGLDNHYTWRPSLGLDNDTLENPLATSRQDILYQLDAITNEGCDAHSKLIIKRWNGPDIYIPTAFTPNKDGINEVLHAKAIGMKQLGYFAVYDRFNNRVFYTTDFTQGWNGKIKDNEAAAGTYVAVAQATDYTGQEVLRKVAVVLIK